MASYTSQDTVNSLYGMTRSLLKGMGLTFLEPDIALVDNGYQLRFRLSCSRLEDLRTFSSERAAAEWLSDILKPVQEGILASPVVRSEIEELEKKNAELRVECADLHEEIDELKTFKNHHDLEMQLRHGYKPEAPKEPTK